ncbi:MAG: ice-binding family protein, partial [Actinomycetota bacterium]|nr:ice-binding family protein [Actinomycetota bacterium]
MSDPSVSATAKFPRFARSALVGAASVTTVLAVIFASSAPASAATGAVDLGSAASYSVLAGQSVTNTGPSGLDGDLGLSPNTGSSITGFPPGVVGGSTHAGDAPALRAQSDLTTAYNDAAGRAPTQNVAGDLVGTTKVAGVYKSSGPLALSGSVTLDGQNDPSSVFIFRVASTLTTATASSVNLINGARACNIFWQVGSSATLGTASVFRGTIMASTSITVSSGALVQGRALARSGSVTLDNDSFISAQCSTTPTAGETSTTQTLLSSRVPVGGVIPVDVAVTGTSNTVPTGTVTVYDNGVAVGSAPVDSTGHARITIPAGSSPGTKIITSHYDGSSTELPSNSTPDTVTVETTRSGPSSSATPNPSRPSSTTRPTTSTAVAASAGGTTTLAATGATQAQPLTAMG